MNDIAQDPSFQSFGALVLKERLEGVRVEIAGVREGLDREYIHRIRVASRRLRSALDVFSSVLPVSVWSECRKPLKKITRQLGAARDADVQVEFLEGYAPGVSETHRAGLERLHLRLRQHREALQPGVLEAMDRLEDRRILESMSAPLIDILARAGLNQTPQSSPALIRLACSAIALCLEGMLSFVPHIQRPENHEEHHQMRIAAKKLRYTLELFAPLFGKELKSVTNTVKEAQSLLGEIHDADVWVAAVPVFLCEEEHRIEAFYGNRASFAEIAPGVLALREERYAARLKYFAEFTAFWKTTEEENIWPKLQAHLQQKLAALPPLPATPPSPSGPGG